MDFADEPSVALIENQAGHVGLDDEGDLAAIRVALGNILGKSLAPAESVELISAAIAEITE